jgi:MFS family permease
MVVVLLGGVTALLPIYAKDILQTGPWGLGLLRACPAIGACVMALWLAHSGWAHRHAGIKMFSAIAVYGAATAAFGLSHVLLVSMICLVLLGAADMVSVVIRHTMVQAETPDHLRGRVSGVNTLFISCSGELGQLRAGYMAGLFSATTAVVAGGIAAIGLSLVWPRLFPDLRRRDHLVADKKEPARA